MLFNNVKLEYEVTEISHHFPSEIPPTARRVSQWSCPSNQASGQDPSITKEQSADKQSTCYCACAPGDFKGLGLTFDSGGEFQK